METSTSWDGTITLANFNTAASALLERWNESNPTLPPWRWVPCSRLPCGVSRKDEGYLVLENIYHFMLNEEVTGEERYCSKEVKIDNGPPEDCAEERFCGEEDAIDNVMLAENCDQETCIYDFHIVYSSSYRVPVLYFYAYRNGQPLGLGDIEHSLPPHSMKILQEARWTYMTREEHPYLNRPWFMLHPCGTSDWMKLLFDRNLLANDLIVNQYLLSWLSVVGQAIGLKITSTMLKWPK
ncbi:ubiquitin-like-conjugating enzyme ATG10 isoform X2 [Aristolochia californica]|uniref:ubiquitin-like-conjugating enzyme ATG10 isoform X2 n=1 Tax=Aristolochia californica TaxID=171875 RepID=UPI0035E33C26